jgi:8-oxo-dGTP pyrophosphatase MutT (NUDIX family)
VNEHRLSCGVVVARRSESDWVTLMLRAFHHWDFPKGIRERGEDPMTTAIREVAEETGVMDLSFDWGDRYFETGPYSRGKIARYFIATTTREDIVMGISPETGAPEHHEWRWVTFDEAYDLGSPRVRQIVQWARQIIGT